MVPATAGNDSYFKNLAKTDYFESQGVNLIDVGAGTYWDCVSGGLLSHFAPPMAKMHQLHKFLPFFYVMLRLFLCMFRASKKQLILVVVGIMTPCISKGSSHYFGAWALMYFKTDQVKITNAKLAKYFGVLDHDST